jgi:hypothetical protein
MSGYLRNLAREVRRRDSPASEFEPRPVRDPTGILEPDARFEGTVESPVTPAILQNEPSRAATDAVDIERKPHAPETPQHHLEREIRMDTRESRVRPPIQVIAVPSARSPVKKVIDSARQATHHEEIVTFADASSKHCDEIPSPSGQPWPAERATSRAEWISVAVGPGPREPLGVVVPATPSAPDIHVSIGRIEVSALVGATATRPAPARQSTAMSLAQYEAKRRECTR